MKDLNEVCVHFFILESIRLSQDLMIILQIDSQDRQVC